MKKLVSELVNNESGLILSAEMVLVLTICVLGVIVGLVQVQTAIVTELQDVALAFSGMNQSFQTPAFFGCRKWWGRTSWTAGSGFIDFYEGCVGTGWGGWGGGGYGVGGMGGGYAEIGGTGYYPQSSTATTITPETIAAPCETCPPGTVNTNPVPDSSSTTVPVHSPLPPPPVPTKD